MTTERMIKYYTPTAHFRIVNPNPAAAKKRGIVWDRGDCAIRALANSTGCTWVKAFDWLTACARVDYNVVNDAGGVRSWLKAAGCAWNACKAEKGSKRATCLDFAKTHPKGRYLIQCANHFTACVNGVILDVWNPADKAVVGFFEMDGFTI